MAFDLLENGGTLVAVISENTLYYNNTEDIPASIGDGVYSLVQ